MKALLKLLNHPVARKQRLQTILVVIWWILNRKMFRLPVLIEIAPSRLIICNPDSSFGSLIVYVTRPEFYEMQYVENHLTTDSVFIDVGAGIGDYSLIASSKIKHGKIFAFEPHPSPRAVFSQNIALNSIRNIILSSDVVSHKTGKVRFHFQQTSELSGISKHGQLTNARTIDSLITEYKLNKIHMLKIDVEGAELSVLQGAKEAMKNNRIQRMVVEIRTSDLESSMTTHPVLQLLSKNNFSCFVFDGHGDLIPISTLQPNDVVNIVAEQR